VPCRLAGGFSRVDAARGAIDHLETLLAVSAQHIAALSVEDAAEFTAELSDFGAASRSLTAGQRP